MRRIALWLMSTVAALVLLFSYRTSTMGGDTATAGAAAGTGAGTTSADGASGASVTGTTYQGSVAQTRWGAAQSANIDTVPGATVTSDGYIRSLQSALDAAHLT